jgi:hypothetical protein
VPEKQRPLRRFGLLSLVPGCLGGVSADPWALSFLRRYTRDEREALSIDEARKKLLLWCRRNVLRRFLLPTVLLAFSQLGCNEKASAPADGERPSEPGMQYSECTESADCGDLPFCVHPPDESGFCSEACAPAGDPESCPDSPGGSATTRCVDIGDPSANLCALDCNGNKSCPGGMRCQEVMTAEGARSLCF